MIGRRGRGVLMMDGCGGLLAYKVCLIMCAVLSPFACVCVCVRERRACMMKYIINTALALP
jgi:hypothetical protein